MAKLLKKVKRKGMNCGRLYNGVVGRKQQVDLFNEKVQKNFKHELKGARRRLDKEIVKESQE